MGWDSGVSRCKVSHTEWLNHKLLLYGTGDHVQSPGINHSGKKNKKEYIYIYVYNIELSCFAGEQKLIQRYKSTTIKEKRKK